MDFLQIEVVMKKKKNLILKENLIFFQSYTQLCLYSEGLNTLSTGCSIHPSKVPEHLQKVPKHPFKVPAERTVCA